MWSGTIVTASNMKVSTYLQINLISVIIHDDFYCQKFDTQNLGMVKMGWLYDLKQTLIATLCSGAT